MVVAICTFSYCFTGYITNFLGFNFIPLFFLLMMLVKILQNGSSVFIVSKYFFLYLFFVFLTLPSLISSEYYLYLLPNFVNYAVFFLAIRNIKIDQKLVEFILIVLLFSVLLHSVIIATSLYNGISQGLLFQSEYKTCDQGCAIFYQIGIPIIYAGTGNPNSAAAILLIGPILSCLFLRLAKNKISIVFFAICLLFSSFALLFTYSRSAILACLIGCFIIILINNDFKKRALGMSLKRLFLATVSIYFGYIIYEYIQGFLSSVEIQDQTGSIESNKSSSYNVRALLIPNYLSIILENPVFGVGYGNGSSVLDRRIGLPISAHNNFISIAAEFGIAASITFGVLLFAALLKLFNQGKNVFENQRLIISAFAAILVALTVHGLFHETYISSIYWLLIGLSVQASRFKWGVIDKVSS